MFLLVGTELWGHYEAVRDGELLLEEKEPGGQVCAELCHILAPGVCHDKKANYSMGIFCIFFVSLYLP